MKKIKTLDLLFVQFFMLIVIKNVKTLTSTILSKGHLNVSSDRCSLRIWLLFVNEKEKWRKNRTASLNISQFIIYWCTPYISMS